MKTNKYIIPRGTKVYNIYFADEMKFSHKNRYFNNQKVSTVASSKFKPVLSTEYDVVVDEFTSRETEWVRYHYLWALVEDENMKRLYILIEKTALEDTK